MLLVGVCKKIWNKKQFLLHFPLQLKLWLVPKTKQKIFFKILFVLFFFCYVPRKDQLTAGSSIYVICFFILFLLVNSSELHWFIHSHGFAVQFIYQTFFTRMSYVSSISRHILCIYCFSFFLGHNELQAESNTNKAQVIHWRVWFLC